MESIWGDGSIYSQGNFGSSRYFLARSMSGFGDERNNGIVQVFDLVCVYHDETFVL
jgi:hypothetical protein